MATTRNRIIYQSEALFIAPNSTGFHIQTGDASGPAPSQDDTYSLIWSGATGRSAYENSATTWQKPRSLLEPMERIQSANFNFTINRQDINEFGQLARLDSIVMESPTVGLDFNYYLTDGGNERKMGFNIPTSAQDLRYKGAGNDRSSSAFWTGDGCISGFSALSGVLNDPQGNNFFITVMPDGKDVQGTTAIASTGTAYTKNDVVAIGNGFISDYTVEAAVGSVPTASVTV